MIRGETKCPHIQGAYWCEQCLQSESDRRISAELAALRAERDRYKAALELIAAPKRPDGTYNRSREACEQIARTALGGEG